MNKKAFASGALGFLLSAVLGLLAWHAYQDHLLVHQVVGFLNQQAQPRQPPTPIPAPSPEAKK